MDITKVNEYLGNAEEHFQNNPEYIYLASELEGCRRKAEECGYGTEKLEKILHQMYVKNISYILDRLCTDPRSKAVEDGFSELDRMFESGSGIRNPYAERLKKQEEKHGEMTSHLVTFRQCIEKTINISVPSNISIDKEIKRLKENPDKIDFDKNFDSISVEARIRPMSNIKG